MKVGLPEAANNNYIFLRLSANGRALDLGCQKREFKSPLFLDFWLSFLYTAAVLFCTTSTRHIVPVHFALFCFSAWNLLARLRVVSPVQQLSVPLQHV